MEYINKYNKLTMIHISIGHGMHIPDIVRSKLYIIIVLDNVENIYPSLSVFVKRTKQIAQIGEHQKVVERNRKV